MILCKREGCPRFHDRTRPMKSVEYEELWNFVCETCGSVRILTKNKVGGTMGSGMKANGCRSVVGRGL